MMTDDEITQPVESGESTPAPASGPKRKVGIWVLIGIAAVVIITAAGGGLGYLSAIQARLAQENAQRTMLTTTQYQLGIVDAQEGRLEMARQRFHYVLQLDPNFPGALEQLSQVEVQLAMAKTPTPAPSPTAVLTPTPDLSGVADILNLARDQVRASQWQAALDTIDSLRSENLTYEPVKADGLYFIALRFRGVEKILQEGDLEGGIYMLALAEQFAPLDNEAISYREWANYYLTGASFWGVKWDKVLYYFAQIYPSFPNLRDTSGVTAIERFRRASIGYGNQLAAAGDYCGAMEQFNNAFNIGVDEAVAPTATEAMILCYGPTSTPKPVTAATPTPTQMIIIENTATETPVVQVPTETPIPPTETTVPTP